LRHLPEKEKEWEVGSGKSERSMKLISFGALGSDVPLTFKCLYPREAAFQLTLLASYPGDNSH